MTNIRLMDTQRG